MKIKKIKICPCGCEEVINKENPLQEAFMCGECESVYEDRKEAKECCKD